MRHVERLLRGRRLTKPVADEDAELLKVAIELRAGAEGAAEPDEEFVAGLRRKVAALETGEQPTTRRRNVLAGASIAAASAVAAVTVERATGDAAQDGVWHRVLAASEVVPGGVRPFQAGAVTGFVARHTDGRLSAVSGACTHLGCRLALNGDATRLDCPCHNTSFAISDQVVRQQLAIVLPPLPTFRVRESGGHIEVFVPL